MYVRYSKQLTEFRERYYELIQEYSQLQMDVDDKRITADIFWRIETGLLAEQNELQIKIEQYKFYDIFDLARDVLRDEFRSLSDDLCGT